MFVCNGFLFKITKQIMKIKEGILNVDYFSLSFIRTLKAKINYFQFLPLRETKEKASTLM